MNARVLGDVCAIALAVAMFAYSFGLNAATTTHEIAGGLGIFLIGMLAGRLGAILDREDHKSA